MRQYLKKAIALVLSLSMITSLLILPASAEQVTAGENGKTIYVSVEAESDSVTSGENFVVTVSFYGNPTEVMDSIQSYAMCLGYDSEKMTPKAITGFVLVNNLKFNENTVFFNWASQDGIKSDFDILASGTLARIQFTAKEDLDATELSSFKILPNAVGSAETKETMMADGRTQHFTVVQTPALEVVGPTADIYTSTTLDTIKTNLVSANYIDATGKSNDVKADVQLSYKTGDNLVEGENTLVATYNGVSCEFTVNAKPVAVETLEITSDPSNMTYSSGDTINLKGMVVKATMNDGTEQADFKGYTVSVGETQVTDGETKVTVADFNRKKITVTANGKTAETSGALTVNKKSVTVPTAEDTYTYTGAEQTFTVGNNTDEAFYTITGDTKGTDAGEYTATAALKDAAESQWTTGNTDDVTLTWTIGKGTYSGESITGAANVPSKGTTNKSYSLSSLNLPAGFVDAKITNAVIGTNDSGLISAGSVSVADGGQSITFSTVEKAKDTTGTITLTISSKNYADVTATLTLTAKDVTVDEATWNLATVDTEFVYGTANKDAVKIASGSYTAQDAEGNKLNGTLTVKNPDEVQNAGSGTITLVFTVTDEGDYKGTTVEKDVTVTIAKKEVTANWGKLSFTYDGQAQVPNATAVGVNGETLTVTVSGEQTDKGTYDATASIASVSGGNANADNYTLTETTTQFTIAPKTLTVSKGDLAYTKEYDGTTTASATGALSVDKVDADDVTVTIGSAVYADETAGTGKTVNLSGLTLAGTKAGNYVLAADTYTFTDGVITAKEVTVSGITAENKEYDGTTAATLVYTGLTITDMVEGDQLSATAIGAFVDKNVADGKTVTISEITLTGADAANYVLAGTGNQPDTTADITAKALTLADGTVKVTKVYDGTTAAGTLTGELALTDAIENDTVSVNMTGVTVSAYPESGYGTYTVILNGIALTGADAANYTVPETYDFAGATITKTVPTMAMLDYALTGVTYNGSAQGVTVTAKESIEGLGAITVKYTKDGETTTTAPVNAGTYTVTASLAEGANYAAQDLELGTYTIAKANRNLTVEPTSLLLYPGSLTAQITASTDTDADKSAVITYKSANTTGVTVNAAGKVTGVSTGKVEITVAIAATTNYNAAEVKVPVTTLMDLLTGAAVTGGTGDKLTAQVADGKLVISGLLTEGETLTIVPYTVSVAVT